MSGEVTLCFYLVIGACVAVALWISGSSSIRSGRWFSACTALLFWPLYFPVLLVSNGNPSRSEELPLNGGRPRSLPPDDMNAAIAQVEIELDSALCSLKGWAEEAVCAEADRFAELRSAWRQHADRIRELDRLLSASEMEPDNLETEDVEVANLDASAREANSSFAKLITTSERLRQKNLSKLKLVRQQWHDDLLATLAWVRQLVTMIHLARYTGEPASRAAELVHQIATAVEGLSKTTP